MFVVISVVGNVALLATIIFLIGHYWIEKKKLRAFAERSTDRRCRDIETVWALAGVIHSRIQRGDDPAFVPLPLFSALGATPISVLRRGGCCSGLSRLYIVSLHTLGIEAGQVTLYHISGNAQHCLVEVWLNGQPMLVDPTYGLYYVDTTGQPVGLRSLQAGVLPRFLRLPYSVHDSYPPNSYYDFAYRSTKTANWTKDRVRRGSYRLLRWLTDGRIDRMQQPPLLEWPQLMLASTAATMLLAFDLLLLVW